MPIITVEFYIMVPENCCANGFYYLKIKLDQADSSKYFLLSLEITIPAVSSEFTVNPTLFINKLTSNYAHNFNSFKLKAN